MSNIGFNYLSRIFLLLCVPGRWSGEIKAPFYGCKFPGSPSSQCPVIDRQYSFAAHSGTATRDSLDDGRSLPWLAFGITSAIDISSTKQTSGRRLLSEIVHRLFEPIPLTPNQQQLYLWWLRQIQATRHHWEREKKLFNLRNQPNDWSTINIKHTKSFRRFLRQTGQRINIAKKQKQNIANSPWIISRFSSVAYRLPWESYQ